MSIALSPSHLLHVWEHGEKLPPYQLALALLQASLPPEDRTGLDEWTIGRRDRYLLRLRERLFGTQIEGLARCPDCDETVELVLSTTDLALPEYNTPTPLVFESDGYRVIYRVPNVGDLAAAMAKPERLGLLQRCVIEARYEEHEVDAAALPLDVFDQLSIQMGNADPQANLEFDLNCPNCAANWQAPFDIVSFLWHEVGAWARRVLREVHVLASAYGWSQEDILRLTPIRRRFYVNMISGGL